MDDMVMGRERWRQFDEGERLEWLVTNGVGGFASGTVGGSLARRYHGLLVAALDPPVGRRVFVGRIDVRATYRERVYDLATNRWSSGAQSPRGDWHCVHFRLQGTTPVWTYALADARLEMRLFMPRGRHDTVVVFRVQHASAPVAIQLGVLATDRDFHGQTQGGGDWDVHAYNAGVRMRSGPDARPLLVSADGITLEPRHTWFYGYALAREAERGLGSHEDLLLIAEGFAELGEQGDAALILSVEDTPVEDWRAAEAAVDAHASSLLQKAATVPGGAEAPTWIQRLVLAADQFLVSRPIGETKGTSIIAGYPWFGDWGRDTMISLAGLTLDTGRPALAVDVLRTFARFVDAGMLPNRFPSVGGAPEYNTVDATLWYFEAIRAVHDADVEPSLIDELYPVLVDIIEHHIQGTRYGICVDPADGLLAAGEPGVQLTWMDAKVGDWVVTPRQGKPVEINALWYHALCVMQGFAERLNRSDDRARWHLLAIKVRASFEKFWHAERGYCMDVIDTPTGDDPTVRPNQIFAVSLPHSPLTRDQQRHVVDTCARTLLTSAGLRSLAPDDERFIGRYGGDSLARDGAYHQGTVWGWLLGPFALAHARVYQKPAVAQQFLAPMADHLQEHGLGSLAEIFDGAAPHSPRGCIAQAWSVAETLRAWIELQRMISSS